MSASTACLPAVEAAPGTWAATDRVPAIEDAPVTLALVGEGR